MLTLFQLDGHGSAKKKKRFWQITTQNSGPYGANCCDFDFDFWCLTPLSAIFQLYHGDQF